MGWDVTPVGSNITTRAFIEYYIRRTYDGIYESVKILEGKNEHGQKAFYVALKKLEDNSVFACVILTQRKNGQVFTKVIGESEQPFYYEVTAKFLEILTPTTHLGSLQWRAECLKQYITNLLAKESA
jgi:hypothetical protein